MVVSALTPIIFVCHLLSTTNQIPMDLTVRFDSGRNTAQMSDGTQYVVGVGAFDDKNFTFVKDGVTTHHFRFVDNWKGAIVTNLDFELKEDTIFKGSCTRNQ